MSAIFSGGRLTAAASSPRSPLVRREQLDPAERARHGVDRIGGAAGIQCRRLELTVAEQDLDHPDVDGLLQRWVAKLWRSVSVPPLFDLGGMGRVVDGAVICLVK